MNLLILGILIGLLYAWGGMRTLMLLDDLFAPSAVARWMADPRGVVQGALGHRSIDSTVQYTRPSREDVGMALEEVAS